MTPNGHLAVRTFLQVFQLQRPLKVRWEPDAGKPSTIWTHLTKNRSPLVISFGSHRAILVTLVNDSEYSRSTDAKSILSLSCIYLVSPGARCFCCGSCVFLLLLLRALTPPHPLINRLWRRGLALGYVGLCVGVMEVAVQCKLGSQFPKRPRTPLRFRPL